MTLLGRKLKCMDWWLFARRLQRAEADGALRGASTFAGREYVWVYQDHLYDYNGFRRSEYGNYPLELARAVVGYWP